MSKPIKYAGPKANAQAFEESGGLVVYYSYDMPIAFRWQGTLYTTIKQFSATTSKHSRLAHKHSGYDMPQTRMEHDAFVARLSAIRQHCYHCRLANLPYDTPEGIVRDAMLDRRFIAH